MLAAIAPFALLALCAAPWLILVGRRFGHMLGAVGVLAGLALLVLASFHVSYFLDADPVWTVLVAVGVGGALGLYLLVRRHGIPPRPGRAAVATWLPASAGLLAWLGTLSISPLVSGSIRGWAMNGDAVNNIQITRAMLDNHGFLLTSFRGVPLQNELLGIAMWAGRGGAASDVFAHDLYALAVFYALAIGLTGMFIGVVVTSLIPSTRPLHIAIVSALASLSCATWFVSGLPIESGYLNVHVVLPFALASWLAHLQSRRHPLASGIVLACLTLVVLESWGPLAVVPAGFGLAILLRHRNRLRVPRGAAGIAVVAVVAMAAIAGAIAAIATFRSAMELLTAAPHGFPFTGIALACAVIGSIATAIVARRRGLADAFEGVVAVCIAAAVGLALLVAINAGSIVPWLAYYPAKYTWLVTVIVLAVFASLLVRLAEGLPARRALPVAAAVVVIALAVATTGPAPQRQNFTIEQPLARILTDAVWTEGERSVNTIIRYNGSPEIIMQWATGSPDEAVVNFWGLAFKGSGVGQGNDTARLYTVWAYRAQRDTGTFTTPPPSTLCAVVTSLGGSAIIDTRDTGLASDLRAKCPEVRFDIRIAPPSRK